MRKLHKEASTWIVRSEPSSSCAEWLAWWATDDGEYFLAGKRCFPEQRISMRIILEKRPYISRQITALVCVSGSDTPGIVVLTDPYVKTSGFQPNVQSHRATEKRNYRIWHTAPVSH